MNRQEEIARLTKDSSYEDVMKTAFNEQVSTYDYEHYEDPAKPSFLHLQKVIEQDLERVLTGKTVFDLAAGTGIWGQYIEKLGYDYSGVDIAEEFVQLARDRDINERVGTAEDSATYPNGVDNIVCIKAFSLFWSPLKVLRHCYKALNPQGQLLIWYYNRTYLLLDVLQTLQRRPSIAEQTPLEFRPSRSEMKRMLKWAGFEPVEWKDHLNFPYYRVPFLRNCPAARWLDDHARFGYVTFVKAVKR